MRDKVLLVTGSTGIGASTAALAAQAGAHVCVVSRTEANCRGLAERLSEAGGSCMHAVADLTQADQVAAAVESCCSTYGRIDAVYNVAGISSSKYGDGPIHECTEAGWDMVLTANVKSMYLMCRAVIGQMLKQPIGADGVRGVVLNMASVLGVAPHPERFKTHGYAASKGAIIAMSRSMAGYYAPHKIRVNVIAPGLTDTPMASRAVQNSETVAAMKSKQPLTDGVMDVDDVARASLFLLGGDARAITGDVLVVDGGWCVSP